MAEKNLGDTPTGVIAPAAEVLNIDMALGP
jgi:hypothetical protein